MQQTSLAAGYFSRGCATAGPLVSKEEFAKARDILMEHLADVSAFHVPRCFVSEQVVATALIRFNTDPVLPVRALSK